METKKRFRMINYPETIDGCHDLIRLLVDKLNESFTTDNSIVSNNNSIPLAGNEKYSQIFSENHCGLNGGVEFGEGLGHRPPLANDNRVRGGTYGTTL